MIVPVVSLIRSGHLTPATLSPLRADRDATLNAIRAAAARVGVSIVAHHNGPHGATFHAVNGDERTVCDAMGPGYRFGWSQYGTVVRRVLA